MNEDVVRHVAALFESREGSMTDEEHPDPRAPTQRARSLLPSAGGGFLDAASMLKSLLDRFKALRRWAQLATRCRPWDGASPGGASPVASCVG